MNESDIYDFLRNWGERTQKGIAAEDWPEFKKKLREVERRCGAVKMHFSMVYETEPVEHGDIGTL